MLMGKGFQFECGDRVSNIKHSGIIGTYQDARTRTHAMVSVPGGPPCNWALKDLWLVARPHADGGWTAYQRANELGRAEDWAGVLALRRQAREAGHEGG